MRHNQNGRRFRGRNNDGGPRHHQGSSHSNHSNHSHSHSSGQGGGGGGGRRVNPRVQTFDSNGPDVRIRGNAYQINEKYVTLARDAASAGDRVLAESYLQHAEHFQRMINDMNEEYNKSNPPQQYNNQQQPITGDEPQPVVPEMSVEQPSHQHAQAQQQQQQQQQLNDLDQSFLRGPRHTPSEQPADGNVRKRETESV